VYPRFGAFRWSAINGGGLCTLLGLIHATESPTGGAANAVGSYAVRPSNNSVPVPTFFVFDCRNPLGSREKISSRTPVSAAVKSTSVRKSSIARAVPSA
jgi:hypothetical protein